jgi:membrane protease YdiL (CAAX protease family)
MITYYRHITTCLAAVAALIAVATLPNLAGGPTPWYVLLGGYAVLTAWSVAVLRREEVLLDLAKPKSGDVTLGIVSGLVVTGTAFFALRLLAPNASPRSAWLFSLYSQFGDVQGDGLRTAGLLIVVVFEELVWRGLVQTQCVQAWGPRKGVPAAAMLFALAHLPALFTMQTPGVGPNPLLPLGALGCGLVWGILVLLTGRLAPAIVCHAVFSYFLAAPAPSWLW